MWTFGHGTAGEVELAALIRQEGIQAVVERSKRPEEPRASTCLDRSNGAVGSGSFWRQLSMAS